jgi:hypothetical protein
MVDLGIPGAEKIVAGRRLHLKPKCSGNFSHKPIEQVQEVG